MRNTIPFQKTIIALVLMTSWLPAATIPKLFNTGVDDQGALLGNGEIDSHYKITVSADTDFPGPDAFTLLPGFPVGPWIDEGPKSRWIAPQASQATGNAPGTYTFTTTFDLTGMDPATAQISGQVSTDNSVAAVRLNGTDVPGITSAGFNVFTAFTIPLGSPFGAGTNTLEFDVSNAGDTVNPAGFRVEMTGRATGESEKPSVATGPASQTAVIGDTVIFTLDAAGTEPLSYQWRFNNTPIAGATDAIYTITGVKTNNAGNYSVAVSNALGTATSSDATLTVLAPFPGIYNTGVNDSRAVLADGEVDPHYIITLNADQPGASNAIAQVTIPAPPWLTNSVKSRWIGPFPDAAAAGGDYVYQLQLNLTGYDPATAFLAGDWATDDAGSLFLNGADTGFRSAGFGGFSTFNITNGFVSGMNALEFRINNGGPNPTGLRVENLRGTAKASTAGQSPPRVVTQPRSATNVMTTSVTFTVVADGTQPLSYQWFQDGKSLDGKTSASLAISPVMPANAGAYTVRISNALGSTNSTAAQLTVVQPQIGVFNTGVDSSGAVLADGDPDPHYLLIASGDAAYPGPAAYAPSSAPIPPWFANDDDSRWIGARRDATEVAPGNYRYRLIFTIDNPAEVAAASLTANVGTDDGNGGIFLNGTQVDFGASGFGNLTELNIPAGGPFVAGVNTLDFIANNGGASANPSGLRVDDIALQGVTVAPKVTLSISKSAGGLQIAWPANATGFNLQESAAVNGPWSNSAATVTVSGANNVATITAAGAGKFYRLSQ